MGCVWVERGLGRSDCQGETNLAHSRKKGPRRGADAIEVGRRRESLLPVGLVGGGGWPAFAGGRGWFRSGATQY